jgi:hypothetical protein
MPWLHRHFMIGSDDHLRALGLLTVDFGAADEALAEYISSLSDIAIADNPPDLKERLQDLNFSAKVKGLRMFVRVVSDRYRLDGSRLFRQLDAVGQMADYRNDMVHGWVQWDSKTKRPAFRNKRKPLRSATATDIGRLCQRLEGWFDEIRAAYADFLDQLQVALRSV